MSGGPLSFPAPFFCSPPVQSSVSNFRPDGNRKVVKSDLVIGTDGAHSAVRKLLMRQVRMDYSQQYIGHGYKELTIRPTSEREFRMDHGSLHIWPRQTFMMIALPNKDKTFTCTLFMPFEKFEEIKTQDEVLAFFEREFPDAIPIIGQENLINDYLKNPVGPLMTVKVKTCLFVCFVVVFLNIPPPFFQCKPYHYQDFCVILGDAAHAMVPFYGQGMNCGFQDVLVLDKVSPLFFRLGEWSLVSPFESPTSTVLLPQLIEKHHGVTRKTLEEYSLTRNRDAEAICDLAVYNYEEMRSSVSSPLFRLRHDLEYLLGKLFPRQFAPLYTMVAFTEIPYSEVKRRWKSQEHALNVSLGLLFGTSLLVVGAFGLLRARAGDLPSLQDLSSLIKKYF